MLQVKELTAEQVNVLNVLTAACQLSAAERKTVLYNITALNAHENKAPKLALSFDKDSNVKKIALDDAQKKKVAELQNIATTERTNEVFAELSALWNVEDAVFTTNIFKEFGVKNGDLINVSTRPSNAHKWSKPALCMVETLKHGSHEISYFFGCLPNGEPVNAAQNEYLVEFQYVNELIKFDKVSTESAQD